MLIKPQAKIRETALTVTRWVGSPQSILVHTGIFVGCFLSVYLHFISLDRMLLVLTTIVSLEAIYLSIFIQISLNSANEVIGEVEQDIDAIQKNVDEIQEDVEGIEKDVDELQEDVEEMTEEERSETNEQNKLNDIQNDLRKLMKDIESLRNKSVS